MLENNLSIIFHTRKYSYLYLESLFFTHLNEPILFMNFYT
jgi:hypothetical protein